jgi:hypothetical protein
VETGLLCTVGATSSITPGSHLLRGLNQQSQFCPGVGSDGARHDLPTGPSAAAGGASCGPRSAGAARGWPPPLSQCHAVHSGAAPALRVERVHMTALNQFAQLCLSAPALPLGVRGAFMLKGTCAPTPFTAPALVRRFLLSSQVGACLRVTQQLSC